MNILLSSHNFAPDIGGVEAVSFILAEQFVKLGCSVKVVTQTVSKDPDTYAFEVFRRPTKIQLFKMVRWCDVLFQSNISLQTAWPLIMLHRPWIVSHQTWIPLEGPFAGWKSYVKRAALRFAINVAISRAMADDIRVPSVLIQNPYRDDIFQLNPNVERTSDLVFVGRLVSDKGVDVLINGFAKLIARGFTTRLTIIGYGPEEGALKNLAAMHGLGGRIEFIGARTGTNLAEILNRYKIMIVPSRIAEPFGIVTLEALACGCVVLGSDGGGLMEAIGDCGMTFKSGDPDSLCEALAYLLTNPEALESMRNNVKAHIPHFVPEVIAGKYYKLIKAAVRAP